MSSSARIEGRRLLFVHAHPDDETLATGATMARYAAEGAEVTLVTCTLGEEGEILVPELALLRADEADQLGGYRIGELARACAELGVRDHRFLGGPGRYRDSGMMGTPANDRPRAFWQAEFDQPVRDLVAVLREVRPQVVVTYDENGGYGHPDHIQAHRVAMEGVARAGDVAFAPELGAPWQVAKVYWSVLAQSMLDAGVRAMRERGVSFPDIFDEPESLPTGVSDEEVSAAVDGTGFFDAKLAAMRAHATQIAVDGPIFALADNVGHQAFAVEHYVLASGVRGPGGHPPPGAGTGPAVAWEDDLFAGIAGVAARAEAPGLPESTGLSGSSGTAG